MCGGFPVPHSPRFRSALFSSRTVGFPESGWRRQLLSRRPFHAHPKGLSVSFHIRPSPADLLSAPLRRSLANTRCSGSVSGRVTALRPLPTESPFAQARYYRACSALQHGSAGVTPPSSLLRTHAPDRHPPVGFGCPYSSRSLQVVPSPCCTTALPDVISAILVPAPGSVPRHARTVLQSVSSRPSSASPQGQQAWLVE